MGGPTCFKRVNVRLPAFVTPDRLGDVEGGVRELLNEYLMKCVVHGDPLQMSLSLVLL